MENDQLDTEGDISYLIYDGDCPFCQHYVHQLISFRSTHGSLELVNAREPHPIVLKYKQRYDFDYGFLFVYHGTAYYADEAIYMLNSLSDPQNVAQRISGYVFRNRTAAKIGYPVLAFLRRLYFRLAGKPFIDS
ncbi:MAG: DUF393 domain-containing protein [Gammaproteobacteria bacterium]|nr:DUF393 domain-containing protein [Gammaproteobacteria bacterium]